MSDKTLNNLLDRYLKGECSDDERKLVEQWYDLLDNDVPDINESELALINKRIQTNLEQNIYPEPTKTPDRISHSWSVLAIAASLVGILITLSYFISAPVETPGFIGNNAPIVDTLNTTGKSMQIILSDGSSVILQPGSSLKYPKQFQIDSREVALSGEAFFEITKNRSRPFIVYSHELVTKVLGTSFRIKHDTTARTSEVSVRTGKVSVTRNSSDQSVISRLISGKANVVLIPNQRVIQTDETKELVVTITDNPIPIFGEDEKTLAGSDTFLYSDMPLLQVFENLSKIYGISIVMEDDFIKGCRFTGDLNGESLMAQLTFICKSTGLTFRVEGTVIQIQGKGCAPDTP